MLTIQFRQDNPNFYREVAENIKILMDDELRSTKTDGNTCNS